MPRREPGVQVPRVISQPGKDPHNLCPAACPNTEQPGQGPPCPPERLLLLLAGTASAFTPTTARPQPGPRGETEARGAGRAALTPGAQRSLLVPPAVFLPSARSPALAVSDDTTLPSPSPPTPSLPLVPPHAPAPPICPRPLHPPHPGGAAGMCRPGASARQGWGPGAGPGQEPKEGVGRARAATQDKNRRGQDRHRADRQTDRQGAAVLTIICH